MERFFNKITLGIGAPLLLAAAFGGAIALAQEGTETPTPAPTEDATPAPSDDSTAPDTTPAKPSKRGARGCPEDGGSSGSGGGSGSTDDGGSSDEPATDDSGV